MAAEQVTKVTLSSGKVVLLRDFKIRHQELAAKAVGPRGSENQSYQNILMQNELIKILTVRVDAADVKPTDSLDDLFTMAEYQQICKVVMKLSGGDEASVAPLIEVVSSGAK